MSIIKRLSSPRALPLHMDHKASGRWCPCGDCISLNDVTIPNRYPVQHIQDFSTNLAGTRFFSKIDLVIGYHQIPMSAIDISKTIIITLFVLYEFLKMPFGLNNAAQSFQYLIDTLHHNLGSIFVYMDDIFLASGCSWLPASTSVCSCLVTGSCSHR